MIVLPEVAAKLQEILNQSPFNAEFEFKVETPGFHLDSIADQKNKRNFIPVFISSMGGTINPVPILKQTEGTIPVAFYFPVRFKNVMFLLNDYLHEQFVGKTLDWGEISGSILSNISLPRYGEIQNLDLQQFRKWVDANFQRPIEIMEPYISMEISIYLSAVGDEFIWGNNVKISRLEVYYKGESIFVDEEPVCIDRADLASSEPAAQQCFGETHSTGFGANAAYTKQLPLIIKNNNSYYNLLEICEKTKDIQNLEVDITEQIPIQKTEIVDDEEVVTQEYLEVTNHQFVTNYSRRTSLGQLLGISLTLSDKRVEEEDEE